MKGENQERKRRELWRLEGRRERENEKGVAFSSCSYPLWEVGVTFESQVDRFKTITTLTDHV